MTFWKKNWHDLKGFQVVRYPKIVTVSYINIMSASENALESYLSTIPMHFLSPESIPGTFATSSGTDDL